MGTRDAAVNLGRTLPSHWTFFLPPGRNNVVPTSTPTAFTPGASALRRPSLRLLPA
jgi:hypothetical protein